MKNKPINIVLLLLCIACIATACESKSIREAKKAFEEKDYSATERLLGDEEIDDPEVERILTIARLYNYYESAQFIDVVEQFGKLATEDQEDTEIAKMAAISKAYIAFDQENYLEAVKCLQEVMDEDLTSESIYEDACNSYIDIAIKNRDAKSLAEILGLESRTSDYIYTKLVTPCDELDYKAFEYMENVSLQLPDSDLKEELNTYLESNVTNKIRSFLIGEWEWQSDTDTKTHVKLIAYKDNLLGEVTQVGDNEVEFQILEGDIYWKDFEFVDHEFFTCYNLSKTRDGNVVDVTATGKIDYENDLLTMHLTAPEPYHMVGADRIWKRIE